jgi:predicted transcriptional regulator
MIPGEPFNPFKVFTGIFIPEAMVRYAGLSATSKLAYGRLLRYAGKDGRCYPAVGTLAAEIAVKKRRAQDCLNELTDGGFIRRDFQSGKATEYVFLWHPIYSGEQPMQEAAPVQDTAPQPMQEAARVPMQDTAPKESHVRESFEESQLFLVEGQVSAPKKTGNLTPEQDAWFSEFWAGYWLKKAKKAARRAFGKHIKSAARFAQVTRAVKAQEPEMLAREPQHRPHAATWLNGERWQDECEAQPGALHNRQQRRQAAIDQEWEAIANGTR